MASNVQEISFDGLTLEQLASLKDKLTTATKLTQANNKALKKQDRDAAIEAAEEACELVWSTQIKKLVFRKRVGSSKSDSFILVRKNTTDHSVEPIFYDPKSVSSAFSHTPSLLEAMKDLVEVFPGKSKLKAVNYAEAAAWVCSHMMHTQENLVADLKPWSNSPEELCEYFIPLEVEEGPTTCWDQFLGRLDLREEFLAFIWSIFDVSDRGRQCVWIRDQGGGGKTAVANAIINWLGPAAHMLSKDTLDNTFGLESIIGKRLLIDSDTKLFTAVTSEVVHKITGGDTTLVNPKGKKMYSASVYSKVLFMSNYFPTISDVKNETSRLLVFNLSPRENVVGSTVAIDFPWEEGLKSEKKQLLYRAKKEYERLVKNHVIPNDRVNYANVMSGNSEFILGYMKKKNIILHPMLKMLKSEFVGGLLEYLKHSITPPEKGHYRNMSVRWLCDRGVKATEFADELKNNLTYLVGVGKKEDLDKLPEDVNPLEEDVQT